MRPSASDLPSASELHPVLARQLEKMSLNVETPPELHDWAQFLSRVSESYQDHDDARHLLERALQTSTTEMEQLNERIRHQASHDLLTGLPNRIALRRVVDELQAAAQTTPTVLTAMFIDLDEFKMVNDTLGHDIGDKLLSQAAERLRKQMRAGDTLARTGGDEFVALCPGLHSEEASVVGARMLESVGQPFLIDGHWVSISASIGVAEADDLNGPDGLLVSADMAMYESKRHGRAQLTRFDADVRRRLMARSALEQDLRTALAGGVGLVVHFQPIVAVASGQIRGFEALVRFNRPGVGLVPPDEFIPIAEKCGLITAIDQWVLLRACLQAMTWQGGQTVSVNMTATDLIDPDTIAQIERALAISGLAPQRLVIELTESAAMSGDDRLAANLTRIRDLGVGLSIDDFGTGYSSLSYLGRMPARTLKIDRSFISDLPANKDTTAIVAAIVKLAHTLGLKVVVEGVETEAQRLAMAELDCDEAQGYYYSRPVPADQVAALLDRNFPPEEHSQLRSA